MKLSILIPLYNKEKQLRRCMNSLLNQDLSPKEYEIVIVDDGSTDSSNEIAKEYSENQDNIHLYKQPNQGPSAARNKALEIAQGDYVYFIDADDYVVYNSLKNILSLAEGKELDILEFGTKEIDEQKISEKLNFSDKSFSQSSITDVLDGITFIAKHDFRNQSWRFIVSKKFLLNTGINFLEDMQAFEDLIFNTHIFINSQRTLKIDLDIHRYVKVQESIVTSTDSKKNSEFIQGMIKAVERLDILCKTIDSSHNNYTKAVKRIMAKKQAVVFALLIRIFKYRLHNWNEINSILKKMRSLQAYPIDRNIGGIDNSNILLTRIVVPVFNNKSLLFLGTKLIRIFPRG